MADWSLLGEHLRAAPVDSLRFTWDELDALVGGLPATASTHRPWWSGNRSHVQQWRAAGFTISGLKMGQEVTFVRSVEGGPGTASAGDSSVQRQVEAVLLDLLSSRLGVLLARARLSSPSGAFIDVDGIATDGSVLVECWAHQGPAKVAQKYKLVNDAAKLHWAASWLEPVPSRLLLCVSDAAAVKHLSGTSWQRQAISSMGVEVVVVDLPPEAVELVLEAQRRQYR